MSRYLFKLENMLLILFVFTLVNFSISVSQETALTIVKDDTDDDEYVTTHDIDSDEISPEKFVPSKNWQTIKPGQAIPAGLHVRINLQTGLNEAKFLDRRGDQGGVLHSKQQLEEALKNIKPEEIKEFVKHEKTKFRNIEEIKKDFDQVMIKVQSETEILQDLLKKYPRASDEKKVEILQNIEYVVHQFDVAQDFVKLNGLDLLIPDLNSTNAKIRSLVAFSLGSAMQGNPKVQIASLENTVLSHLLRIVSFDPEPKVRNRAMFAISCLVRQFPLAQQHLLKSGGFTTFADIFKEPKWDLESKKLQMKVVNLIQDLITEQIMASKYSKPDDEINQERVRQYNKLNLGAVLVQNGFCKIVPRFLASSDVDSQEKVVSAMLSLVKFCSEDFKNNLKDLHKLQTGFKEKASIDDDDYFSELLSNIQNLIKEIDS